MACLGMEGLKVPQVTGQFFQGNVEGRVKGTSGNWSVFPRKRRGVDKDKRRGGSFHK